MKISSELRQAIKSIVGESRDQNGDIHLMRQRAINNWIESTPRLRKLLIEYKTLIEKSDKLKDVIEGEFGVRAWDKDVCCAETARKKGLDYAAPIRLSENAVFSRLARCTPSEGAQMLKELGVVWE